jgi:hypothetical protein
MRALVPGLVAMVLLCGCTGGSSDGAPATSVHPLLAQVGEVLGAVPTDPEVEHPIPPECPAAYHRVLASATYAGARVAVDVASGPCPGRDGGYYACRGIPDLPGHAIELRDCSRRRLADGRVLVAGRQRVYQEGTYRVAAIWRHQHTCIVGSPADSGLATEDLSRVATEIRCE